MLLYFNSREQLPQQRDHTMKTTTPTYKNIATAKEKSLTFRIQEKSHVKNEDVLKKNAWRKSYESNENAHKWKRNALLSEWIVFTMTMNIGGQHLYGLPVHSVFVWTQIITRIPAFVPSILHITFCIANLRLD